MAGMHRMRVASARGFNGTERGYEHRGTHAQRGNNRYTNATEHGATFGQAHEHQTNGMARRCWTAAPSTGSTGRNTLMPKTAQARHRKIANTQDEWEDSNGCRCTAYLGRLALCGTERAHARMTDGTVIDEARLRHVHRAQLNRCTRAGRTETTTNAAGDAPCSSVTVHCVRRVEHIERRTAEDTARGQEFHPMKSFGEAEARRASSDGKTAGCVLQYETKIPAVRASQLHRADEMMMPGRGGDLAGLRDKAQHCVLTSRHASHGNLRGTRTQHGNHDGWDGARAVDILNAEVGVSRRGSDCVSMNLHRVLFFGPCGPEYRMRVPSVSPSDMTAPTIQNDQGSSTTEWYCQGPSEKFKYLMSEIGCERSSANSSGVVAAIKRDVQWLSNRREPQKMRRRVSRTRIASTLATRAERQRPSATASAYESSRPFARGEGMSNLVEKASLIHDTPKKNKQDGNNSSTSFYERDGSAFTARRRRGAKSSAPCTVSRVPGSPEGNETVMTAASYRDADSLGLRTMRDFDGWDTSLSGIVRSSVRCCFSGTRYIGGKTRRRQRCDADSLGLRTLRDFDKRDMSLGIVKSSARCCFSGTRYMGGKTRRWQRCDADSLGLRTLRDFDERNASLGSITLRASLGGIVKLSAPCAASPVRGTSEGNEAEKTAASYLGADFLGLRTMKDFDERSTSLSGIMKSSAPCAASPVHSSSEGNETGNTAVLYRDADPTKRHGIAWTYIVTEGAASMASEEEDERGAVRVPASGSQVADGNENELKRGHKGRRAPVSGSRDHNPFTGREASGRRAKGAGINPPYRAREALERAREKQSSAKSGVPLRGTRQLKKKKNTVKGCVARCIPGLLQSLGQENYISVLFLTLCGTRRTKRNPDRSEWKGVAPRMSETRRKRRDGPHTVWSVSTISASMVLFSDQRATTVDRRQERKTTHEMMCKPRAAPQTRAR
ncbi:hypothetical protein C8R45DRAFT_944804 [Mycena sanguinolenta]|nr:hypothetical protein C8R45DRAFT_944804 [Mycena sanguinolenta]